MMMMSTLLETNTISWIFNWNNNLWVDVMLLHSHINPIPSQPVFVLIPYWCVPSLTENYQIPILQSLDWLDQGMNP
jgi:hypothetical protein